MNTALEIATVWLAFTGLFIELSLRCSGWGDE